jgi:group I intron endonuclease
MKISGVYKITNTVTNDCYIGSSNDVKRRWKEHKKPSMQKKCPNNKLYQDMQKYGVDKFDFQILANVEVGQLKEAEQQFIEKLQPTYNSNRAKGFDIERRKEYKQSEKYKEYMKEYRKSEKYKECQKKYEQSEKHKECYKEYYNQLCFYNGKILKFGTLCKRFYRAGIEHPMLEAKKYLLDK